MADSQNSAQPDALLGGAAQSASGTPAAAPTPIAATAPASGAVAAAPKSIAATAPAPIAATAPASGAVAAAPKSIATAAPTSGATAAAPKSFATAAPTSGATAAAPKSVATAAPTPSVNPASSGAFDTERPIRVLIADDQDIVRSGFRLVLMSYDGIDVVGEARDGKEAVALAERLRPDVVLMDIRMPHQNGIEATRVIRSNPELEGTHVLILTTFDHDEYVYEALAAGASGFLLKDADPDQIVAAVRVVAEGNALIEPSITRRLIESFVASRPHGSFGYRTGAGLESLTDREREILMLVARGLSNDEIGAELVISPATVKTHIARIMAKVDAHDRAQLVIWAYESGLVKQGGR